MKCLKWQKKVTLQLKWMSFLQNWEICFNEERLPINYHNFRHKSLVRPKIKSPNWQESQPISYKSKFSERERERERENLVDLKYNITYQNIWGKLRSDQFLYPEMLRMMAEKLPNNLHEWAFYKIMRLVDVKFNITYQNKQREIKARQFLRA